MHTVLMTGFEPFGDDPVNPSWQAVAALDGTTVVGDATHGPALLVARQLPCVFEAAGTALLAAIETVRPTLVIAVGLAGGRFDMTAERIAINIDDARIPDNAGHQPIDTPIVAHGPAAYFSTLPIKAIVHALRGRGVPASVSQTAGTFVCNHVFYQLQHYIATRAPNLRGGFVHVPWLPEQAARHPGQPSMALPTMIDGLRTVVTVSLACHHDLLETGGAEH